MRGREMLAGTIVVPVVGALLDGLLTRLTYQGSPAGDSIALIGVLVLAWVVIAVLIASSARQALRSGRRWLAAMFLVSLATLMISALVLGYLWFGS